jgi:hypothetical protein
MIIPISLQKEMEHYINAHQPEIYWDYRDEMCAEHIAKIFRDGSDGLLEVENEIVDLNIDHIFELEHDARKEFYHEFKARVKASLVRPGYKKWFSQSWKKCFKSWLAEMVIADANLKDLMRSSGELIFFYDLSLELTEEPWQMSKEAIAAEVWQIKKLLGIRKKNTAYDKQIHGLVINASYGGSLEVYFRYRINELLDIIDGDNSNFITFTNPHLGIIDHSNGSGDVCFLNNFKFSVPYNRENLFYENSVHYNWTNDICGMEDEWCKETGIALEIKKTRRLKPEVSDLHIHLEREAGYDVVFKAGRCTRGDTNISRHRDTYYLNEYPCGSHCPHCGQFWVD